MSSVALAAYVGLEVTYKVADLTMPPTWKWRVKAKSGAHEMPTT